MQNATTNQNDAASYWAFANPCHVRQELLLASHTRLAEAADAPSVSAPTPDLRLVDNVDAVQRAGHKTPALAAAAITLLGLDASISAGAVAVLVAGHGAAESGRQVASSEFRMEVGARRPRTRLGRRLLELRARLRAEGAEFLTLDQIEAEVASRRNQRT